MHIHRGDLPVVVGGVVVHAAVRVAAAGVQRQLAGPARQAAAAPLLVFCLLYTPCIAAVASVKRELGGRWAAVMVLNQCVVAWVAAFIVRMLALALV